MERKDTDLHQETLRLNRYLALAGVGSRRKNDELILSGAVRVNGTVVKELGSKVDPLHDRVTVNGKPVLAAQRSLYILLNKPKDCITTLHDERGRTTVLDYVRLRQRVYPVGRLDRDTTGILLLTNDGDLAHRLTHPSSEIEKIYRARLDKSVTDDDLRALRKGVRLSDGPARAAEATVIPGTRRREVILSVHEGRNHLVRRMFEAQRYTVRQLERLGFAGLTTQGVARGKWRFLHHTEVQHLKTLTAHRDEKHA
ncbi:MAG: rRNA pseudouridine synthase [Ignavibacteriales bacterium]|nr:rRNA pseudouridine synthase [Ignavibacteriales bacterium]